jgi:hypothetical protein
VESFTDHEGRTLRLTAERAEHIERRPEMIDQRAKIEATLADPDEVRVSDQDDGVRLYYRHYAETPVTEKQAQRLPLQGGDTRRTLPLYLPRIYAGRVRIMWQLTGRKPGRLDWVPAAGRRTKTAALAHVGLTTVASR